MKKITIIGCGVMGRIFANALSNDFLTTISDHNKENLKISKKNNNKIKIETDNVVACKNADIVLLAIKPQSFVELAKELKGKIDKAMVVSIMAGVSIKKIETLFGVEKVVRAMPNLGARVLMSMTVWTAKNLSIKENLLIKKLFQSIGSEMFVTDEKKINMATAVSGSGPGFFYYIVEEWINSAKKLGFTADEAKQLVLSTIDGANELLQVDCDPESLRKQVTSKAGTTEAGLKVLSKSQIKNVLLKTMQNALKRAIELAK